MKNLTILLLLSSACYFAFAEKKPEEQIPVEQKYMELKTFTKVLNLIQQYYITDVDFKKLIYGGIKGMLRELDPHTNFLPPDIFSEFEKETSGEFGGIGVEISVQEGALTIISPIEDTPAWHAGIQPGDKIVGLNGRSTKGMSIVEAAKEMRGKEGVNIELSIMREGFEVPKDFLIKRGKVKLKSVKYTDFADGYAYFRVTSFVENTGSDLRKLLEKHHKSNKKTSGIILDLRRNPGGLLDQAVEVSDMFLSSGAIVSTVGRNEKEKETVFASEKGTFPKFPIVVLIDSSSASASEIVAGALQDNKRALVVGERSFGKGSVQSVVKLGDGSGLKLTVATYLTPSGRSIQAEGIDPDIIIAKIDMTKFKDATVTTPGVREADIEGHLLGVKEKKGLKDSKDKKSSVGEIKLSEDFQLQQAFAHLKTLGFLDSRLSKEKQKAQPL